MGRTLANTMVNLGIVTSVDEALYQVRLCYYTTAVVFPILGVYTGWSIKNGTPVLILR